MTDLAEAFTNIELFAPNDTILEAARALYERSVRLRRETTRAREERIDPASDQRVRSAYFDAVSARDEFMRVVSEDLGVRGGQDHVPDMFRIPELPGL